MGLNGKSEYSPDDVKKAFKSASFANHPDRGGSTEVMQRVNSAYDLLKKGGSSLSSLQNNFRKKQAEVKKKYEMYGAMVKRSMEQNIDPQKFADYLKKVIGKSFKITKNKLQQGKFNVSFDLELTSEDELDVFILRTYVQLDSFAWSEVQSLGNTEKDFNFEMTVTGDAFLSGKKYKLFKKSWGNSSNTMNLNKPEEFFPKKKLEKHIAKTKTEKGAQLKKRDVMTFFTKVMKFRRSSNGDYISELKDNHVIIYQRNVFLRKGFYMINLYERKGKFSFIPKGNLAFVPEGDPLFLDLVKEIDGKTESQVKSLIKKYAKKMEINHKL